MLRFTRVGDQSAGVDVWAAHPPWVWRGHCCSGVGATMPPRSGQGNGATYILRCTRRALCHYVGATRPRPCRRGRGLRSDRRTVGAGRYPAVMSPSPCSCATARPESAAVLNEQIRHLVLGGAALTPQGRARLAELQGWWIAADAAEKRAAA